MASEGVGGDSDTNISAPTPKPSPDDGGVASEGRAGDSETIISASTPAVADDGVVASEEGGDSGTNVSASNPAVADDSVVLSGEGDSETNISTSTPAAVDDRAVESEGGDSENTLASTSSAAVVDNDVVASEGRDSASAVVDNSVAASGGGDSPPAVVENGVAASGGDSSSAVVENGVATSEGGDSVNISISGDVDNEDDVKYGFKRPEMNTKDLQIVAKYKRHVFLCYKSYESWPSRLDFSEADPVPKLLLAAFEARKPDMKFNTRMTICERLDGGKSSDGDVLIFPDMIIYRDIKESEVDSFVEEVLVKGNPWSGSKDVLTGSYVFVCAHNQRDRRCGVCGPALIKKFKTEIESKSLKDKVFVSACSHIGGHQFAGNAIIFSANTEGKIEGNWYGYVTPDDVPALLDQQIGKGKIIKRLWRGEMAGSVELPISSPPNNQENSQVSGGQETNGTFSGCGCSQGVPVNSCCGGGISVEEKVEGSVGNPRQEEVVERSVESLIQEVVETSGGNQRQEGEVVERSAGERKDKPSTWKKSGVLTTVGLIGAVVAVGVIYGFCRRSK